ncbi:hypothetical protein PMAYCL1PPCAC_24994, partial [Pristionchus mayeri]
SFAIIDLSEGERLLSVFKTLPPIFYTLVMGMLMNYILPFQKINYYIDSCVKERAENKAARPVFCASDNREKTEEV